MANRMFRQFMASPVPAVVKLYARISFGAAGAPTLSSANGGNVQGIKSIVRNSAGNYTITLGIVGGKTDTYASLLMIGHCPLAATAPTAPLMNLLADSVASTGSVQIEFNSSAGVATDPASGESVLIEITVKNSSAI